MADIYGTSSDDYLEGSYNTGPQRIYGLEGNDTLQAAHAEDILIGGPGADTLMGDIVSYETTLSGVTISLRPEFVNQADENNDATGDVYSGTPEFIGSNHDDVLYINDYYYSSLKFNGLDGYDIIDFSQFHGDVKLNLTGDPANSGPYYSSYTYLNLASVEEIVGTEGPDEFFAGAGSFTLNGSTWDGHYENDTLSYIYSKNPIQFSNGYVSHGTDLDIISNFENLIGSNYDDYFDIRSPVSYVDAGEGQDMLSFINSDEGVNFDQYGIWGEFHGFEIIQGSMFNDTLYGQTKNTTFIATPGDDRIFGYYYLQFNDESIRDTVIFNNSNGSHVDLSQNIGYYDMRDQIHATALFYIEDIKSGKGNDIIIGNEFDNLLESGSGDDTLEGGAGADTLDGGAGFDIVNYEHLDTSEGIHVNLSNSNDNSGPTQGDVLLGIEGIIGTQLNDRVITNNADTSFRGGDGFDILDFSEVTAGLRIDLSDKYHYEAPYYTTEAIKGSKFADYFFRYYGDINFIGSAGADTIYGSINANVWYLESPSAVQVNLVTGINTGGDAQGDIIEYTPNITASNFNDVLVGGDWNNLLHGAAGSDTIYGGGGDDTILGGVGDTGPIVQPAAANEADMIYAGTGDDDVTTNTLDVGSIVYGQAGKDTITVFAGKACGGEGNDVLIGKADGAQLYGDSGNDSLTMFGSGLADGGWGNDTYIIHANNVTIIEGSNAGLDEVQTDLASFTLANHLERLIFTGTGGFTGIGNAQANFIQGGSGNDILLGAAGADTLDGGTGKDAAWYLSSEAAVQVNLPNHSAAGGDAAGDVLINIENLTGSNFNDLLLGDSQDNLLQGAAGNDTIYGGAGNDTILGDVGDTGSFEHATPSNQADLIYAGPGADIVTTNTLDLGSIVYGQDGADTITVYSGTAYGGTLNDQLTGKAQGASLFGEAGNDSLTLFAAGKADGGEGSDTFEVRTTDQVRIEDHGTVGTDSVYLFNIATLSDVATIRLNDDLYVTTLADAEDGHAESGVLLPNWYGSNSNSIELFIVGNGDSISFNH